MKILDIQDEFVIFTIDGVNDLEVKADEVQCTSIQNHTNDPQNDVDVDFDCLEVNELSQVSTSDGWKVELTDEQIGDLNEAIFKYMEGEFFA